MEHKHPSFVPLHVHSQYSILDASASIQEIVQKATDHQMSAVALTDHGNLFGAIEFYKACKDAKIKPIIGCEFYIAPGSRLDKKRIPGLPTSYHLVLLAKNAIGYQNLCKLSSIGYLEGFYYNPRIDQEMLQQHSEGLICLSGPLNSQIAQLILNGTKEQLHTTIQWFKDIFGDDFYLELQRHSMSDRHIEVDGIDQETWLYQQYQEHVSKQEKVNQALLEIAQQYQIKYIATNDSHYMEREDWRAHEILLNVQSGEPCEIWENDSMGNPKVRIPNPKRMTYPSHEYYFKSHAQMQQLFQDLPEAITTTAEIADKCNLEIDLKTRHYPVYIPPALANRTFTKEEQAKEVEEYLWTLCREGIPKRYNEERLEKVKEQYPSRDPLEVVKERLNYEMSIIVPKGMGDYLLIVWDFINWAKNNQIPMGPGRGSGAGSIVLYLIGITDIEPLRFNLFFERFINPERLSYPDIDVDICMERRSDVIGYTLQKYGKDNIAQIITFGTMKAKMSIKDVGRALGIPLTKVNAIAKLVPEDLNITLDKALEKDPDLLKMYQQDEEAKRVLDFAKKLEGCIRNTGLHAAGIIISGEPLTNYIPLCSSKDSTISVTQFSMKPVEQVGMLKVDFLGLKTLTCIKICVDAIRVNTGREIDWVNLPLDDAPAFNLLNQGKTMGIFQLESGGMQDLARHLHLDKFEEIIAVGALYRPGPMDMIPSFINRKHGREPIENDHPLMKDILNETYGIMVYQEQVMQIASKLANFTLGEGDVLRRAMGKKDLEQMITQREKFRLGALQNGIDEKTSMLIFDKIEKFAAYGFNKSHAAAYGYLTYVTAYLKANYPKEWMAALMTCDRDDLTKVAKFIHECQTMNIAILPPDVNEAGVDFTATPQGIRFAMTGIKGVGSGVVEAIIEERNRKGPFNSLYQFFKRMDSKKIGKKVVENLVDAGCFDFTTWTRDALRMSVDPLYEIASKEQKEAASGILNLFSSLNQEQESQHTKPPVVKHPTGKQEMLLKEKELLGFFLTGHPMDEYKQILKRLSCISLRRVAEMDHDTLFRSAFIVESCQVKVSSKTQKKFAILTISDGIERYELPIWSELYDAKGPLLRENQLLYAILQVDKKEENIRLSCRWLDDLTNANEEMMHACDTAYDKAKQFVGRGEGFRKAKEKEKEKAPPPIKEQQATKERPMSETPLIIALNANTTRLSHILQLKKLFSQHRGEQPVQLSFLVENKEIAVLHIDKRWGINPTSDFQHQLDQWHTQKGKEPCQAR
jgi:DNA polymerase-3 subunit alpha